MVFRAGNFRKDSDFKGGKRLRQFIGGTRRENFLKNAGQWSLAGVPGIGKGGIHCPNWGVLEVSWETPHWD